MCGKHRTQVLPGPGPSRLHRLLLIGITLCGSAGFHLAWADNIVTDWNNEFLLITQQTSGNLVAGPPEVAREIAQVGAAMSDAVNAATGSAIPAFADTAGPVANANSNIAAATAAYTALTSIFKDPVWSNPISSITGKGTNSSNTALASIVLSEINSLLTAQLTGAGLANPTACATSHSVLCNGYNLGLNVATAVDNSATFSPTASGAVAAVANGLTTQAPVGSGTTAGVYVPPTSRPEMLPTWGTTTPTGMTSRQLAAAESTVPPPPAITSAAYANALLMTECQGSGAPLSALPANVQGGCVAAGYSQETTRQANAALFWNDPGTTIQPPGHWLQIADTVMNSQSSSLLQSAQLTALLGEAMNDAGVAAWQAKYTYNLWRPVTAIRDCANWSAGNFTTCDRTWTSLIATPPHPDYVAGHPAFSGAAAAVLADYFGTDQISFTSTSNYYCNGATSSAFDPATRLLVSCTLGTGAAAVVYSVSRPADCARIVNGVNSNGSPLICPISETFDSFSAASGGLDGAEYSRVVGGIHTPFSVETALALGTTIGQAVAANADLPEIVPEPSGIALCIVGLLPLGRLRRRRRFSC